jgi:type VI secretion system protein ImpC
MTQRAQLELTLGTAPKGTRRSGERPLRILIVGDFSGRAQASSNFVTHRLSVDNVDQTIAKLHPVLRIPDRAESGSDREVTIAAFEHLHPDYLATAVPELEHLLELRRRLAEPTTERQALAELDALTTSVPSGASPAADRDTAPRAAGESEEELFGRLLGRTRTTETDTRAKETVQRLIQDALGPDQTPPSTERAADGAARVAELLGTHLRQILHAPGFRNIERAWRGAHWLLTRLEDDDAELYLLDLSKTALAEHLGALDGQLDASPLRELLADAEPGWDLIIGDYSFGLTPEDIVLLATLGALAASAQAPFIAHGELTFAGCPGAQAIDAPWDWSFDDEELGKLWTELRAHPAAKWITLAAPRFLLRYPYGPKNDPTTVFDFEELPVSPSRERFLWGNPAFACALLVGRADGTGSVPDLPTPLYRDSGGDAIQPPLEFLLNERARAAVSRHGLVVFSGGRNTNRVAADSVHSIAAD